ncbi:MAG: hypothetical protein M0Q91_13370 [Methanoregula sp.]|jgi:hypothetical protein|nr:hypothetical protein [Methanoregula sp.]
MKNMSFFLTTQQFIDGTKDVTRRLGWAFLKPGDHFMAVEKAQGLKKGEKIRKLGQCVCVWNQPEPLNFIQVYPYRQIQPDSITGKYQMVWNDLQYRAGKVPNEIDIESEREGFPSLYPVGFIEMFCREMSTKKRPVTPETIVNRIEFARVVA